MAIPGTSILVGWFQMPCPGLLYGKCRRVLGIRQYDTRRDLLDARQLRQLLEEELLVGLDVLGHDPQQEIDIAEQHVAIHHFGKALHGFGKCGQVTAPM